MKNMAKPLEFHGVEAEKAEAMRRYNNQKRFRNIIRAAAAAFLSYLWPQTVAISLQAAGGWLYRTGAVIVTNRTFVFVLANILVAFIFLLSRHRHDEESTEPDMYDQYTSASDEKKVVDDGDSNKQIVPVFVDEEEVVVEAGNCKRKKSETMKKVVRPATELRRTESERKKEIKRPMTEFRRTESANSAIERLNSEEFRLTIEAFIINRKKRIVQEENDVVASQEDCSYGLELVGADSAYGSS